MTGSTLTSNQKLFVLKMTENEEQEQKGYELLIKKGIYPAFFDEISSAGLFAPSRNSGPVPAKEEGYVQIPYWAALSYLEACAKYSAQNEDYTLAKKVMHVVRSVSLFCEQDGKPRLNYHTSRMFAEILGLLPMSVVTLEDLNLISIWVSDRFDRGLVCNALDTGAMPRFVKSDSPEDWNKALRILYHCTSIVFLAEKDEVQTVVDNYWLKEFIGHHVTTLSAKLSKPVAEFFVEKLSEVFGTGARSKFSYLFRPAIEDHTQNHDWHGPENRFVEGLREALLSWVASDPNGARFYIHDLLNSKVEIVRRVAIHLIDQKWAELKTVADEFMSPTLFAPGHLHEMYLLLDHHFQEMGELLQAKVLEAIRGIPIPEQVKDKEAYIKEVQFNWLSAIQGKGMADVDAWFAELATDINREVSGHPDFHSYIESSWGYGSSPFPAQTLVAYAKESSLVEKLNGFVETNRWKGATVHGLVDALQEAVCIEPQAFLDILPNFHDAKRPYQYGIIAGFKQVLDKTASGTLSFDWQANWKILVQFLKTLLSDDFWKEVVPASDDWAPTRSWIPPMVAELLKGGTHDGDRIFPEDLHGDIQALVEILLEKADPIGSPGDDPMFQSINSPKGKAVELLILFALMVCRLAEHKNKCHHKEWEALQPLMDRELDKCKDANYEFSTLVSEYMRHFEFLSYAWLEQNVNRIFPSEYGNNFVAALSGLAYCQPSQSIYRLLMNAGVIEKGLSISPAKAESKERLAERVALAYLWGDEQLDSPRFKHFFTAPDIHALEIISQYFWSVSNQELDDKMVERIKKYWLTCVEWARDRSEPPAALLSKLSLLSRYLDNLNDENKELLKYLASYTVVNHGTDRLIEELDRLASVNPGAVYEILMKLLDAYEPYWDLGDRLKSIATKLHHAGLCDDALELVDRLRKINGMDELFVKLKNTPPPS